MSEKNSYAQVLKASSIMGGAAGITLLLGMARVKFAAVLIGATGVGLNASFTALQGVVGTIAGLGVQSSAVRDIAAAVAADDKEAISRTVLTLRRICWLTGLAGLAAMLLLAPLLSQLTFGNRDHTLDISALGLVILFANLSGGQLALIQGMRRIGDLARANILGAALGTLTAVGLYAWLGLRGIVPALVIGTATQLALSWHFARRVSLPKVNLTFLQTISQANGMVRLGLVMMATSLMGSAVAYITVLLISQHSGVEAIGLYSAAFALSGMFVNFVLGAMSADYYPRLTAVAADRAAMCRMVNEQTEIGLLLAVPGLMATMALSPWILQIFYSPDFLEASTLLQWFLLGCVGRVISWPLGFVMLALGKERWFLLTETCFHLAHISLVAAGIKCFGFEGIAIAFFATYLVYIFAVHTASNQLIGFSWSRKCKHGAMFMLPMIGITFLLSRNLPLWPASIAGIITTLVVFALNLRALTINISPDHRIHRAASKFRSLLIAGVNRRK